MSTNFAKLVRRHGFYATIRQAKNLGISLEDVCQMAFGVNYKVRADDVSR